LIAGTAIFATAASAQQFGTADEAKAMLTKTVSALKADKAKTLDLINEGKDRGRTDRQGSESVGQGGTAVVRALGAG
jgi:hypothetical protein